MAIGEFLFEENFDDKNRWEIALDTEEVRTQHFAVGTGRFRGVNFTDNHNVVVLYLSDGVIRYEEKGIISGENGEIVTWTGHGVGRPNKKGGYSGRGSYLFKAKGDASVGAGKKRGRRVLASLDNVIGVYELESDSKSNGSQKWWRWE